MDNLRIGQGFDVHAFEEGDELIIGGVHIPFDKKLKGHSDADVLLHAIMDALLGAAGLPDIGQQFPPNDDSYKYADSAVLLSRVNEIIRKAGFRKIINIDATIIAELPKMSPHIEKMRKVISEILRVKSDLINIKATTTEKLGFTGREEGIAAMAVCLIERNV
ncbi:MAG: 2-C-methyl-D-erythritol 2,4-cyclodiphosphate synthase [bacterium]